MDPNADPSTAVLPLAEEGPGSLDFWRGQITAAQARIDKALPAYRQQMDAYRGQIFDAVSKGDRVPVPKDFSKVERKRAALVFHLPEVTLKALQPDLQSAVAIFQARVNEQLGIDGIDALTMLNEVVFDILCPSGFGVSKIGYEAFVDGTVPIQVGTEPGPPAPLPPGSVLGLSAPPAAAVPIMRQVPRIIHERYYWERVSPAKLLKPATFRGSDYDKAPWLGVEFVIPKHEAIAKGWATEDTKTIAQDERLLILDLDLDGQAVELVRGAELWYRAYAVDPAVKHPEKFRQLVIMDGDDAPVVHRDSPYQRWDPATGKFTAGMIGNPIHVCLTRTLGDSSTPKSDVAMSREQVLELSKGRTQMIQQRDRSIPLRLADIVRLGGPEKFQAILNGDWQALIGVENLEPNNPPIQEVARSAYPREDFTFDQVINRDIDEAWGMGANQVGLETEQGKTATEQAMVQRNSDARLDKERQEVLRFFAKGTVKFAALLQLFDDRQDLVAVLGANAERVLEQWDRTKVQGRWAFEVRPDAGARIDGEQYMKSLLDAFNFLAKDPHINRMELLRPIVSGLKLDPTRAIVEQLPAKPPDAANVSFRFQGDDLDVTSPKWPIIEALLKQSGYQIPDDAIAAAREHAALQASIMAHAGVPMAGPPGPVAPITPVPDGAHPGLTPPAEKLNQHALDETGALPNAPAAARPGGMLPTPRGAQR